MEEISPSFHSPESKFTGSVSPSFSLAETAVPPPPPFEFAEVRQLSSNTLPTTVAASAFEVTMPEVRGNIAKLRKFFLLFYISCFAF